MSGFAQPRTAGAGNRNSAAKTANSPHVEFTPAASAMDQLRLLVRNRPPGEDNTLARFRQKIVPHLDSAYNFARLLSQDADAAEEIVQETFLRAYRSFAGYRGGEARVWIFAIVRSCYQSWLIDQRRKRRLDIEPQSGPAPEEPVLAISSDEQTAEAMPSHKAESRTVDFIVESMPRSLREVLALRELEALSYHQISDITALPIGTVMSRLARARKVFGDAWSSETKNPGLN